MRPFAEFILSVAEGLRVTEGGFVKSSNCTSYLPPIFHFVWRHCRCATAIHGLLCAADLYISPDCPVTSGISARRWVIQSLKVMQPAGIFHLPPRLTEFRAVVP